MTFLSKIIYAVRHRPLAVWENLRGRSLFYLVAYLRLIREIPGTEMNRSVRVQRYTALRAELPRARIRIGDNSIIYESNRCEAYGDGVIEIGENCILGGAKIVSRNHVQIGARLLCSWNVFIQDFDPHPVDASERAEEVLAMVSNFEPRLQCQLNRRRQEPKTFSTAPITIGDDVWIGAGATILKGADVGNGCIVGAGAVVTSGKYPDNSILVGNPARVVKSPAEKESGQ